MLALKFSPCFRGIFLAACCSLLLPELSLLAAAAAAVIGAPGGAENGVYAAVLLCWGIKTGYTIAVAGGEAASEAGPVGIAWEVIGVIAGVSATNEVMSDEMDAVDNQ